MKNNIIYQYIPSFFDGFTPTTGEFETLDELITIPFVRKFVKDETFIEFALSADMLMAKVNQPDGTIANYPIGRIKYPEKIVLKKENQRSHNVLPHS